MPSLDARVTKLERSEAEVDLKGMTDEQLSAHAKMLPTGSRAMYAAVLTLVGRRNSKLPIVHDDPERGWALVRP